MSLTPRPPQYLLAEIETLVLGDVVEPFKVAGRLPGVLCEIRVDAVQQGAILAEYELQVALLFASDLLPLLIFLGLLELLLQS